MTSLVNQTLISAQVLIACSIRAPPGAYTDRPCAEIRVWFTRLCLAYPDRFIPFFFVLPEKGMGTLP